MKRLCIALLLIAACSRERRTAGTTTIAPAEPRPLPTATTTQINLPAVTTSGSPPPGETTVAPTEAVTITSAGIEIRQLLPRAHTAFRIGNETSQAHALVLRGPGGSAAATVPPRGSTVLQLVLNEPRYELVCTTPGHSERATFTTYVPGVPLGR